MITPRRTRLVRVPDLQTFRRTIRALAAGFPSPQDAAVLVPTRAAASVLGEPLGADGSLFSAALVTRDELYDELHRRLPAPPRRLTPFERDAIAQAAATAAATGADLPFSVRPGLVSELLRFYDQLRRQPQLVVRFEELIVQSLGGGDVDDRGAERLLAQTRFLADTFRHYERLVAQSGACDEHTLRTQLAAAASSFPLTHLVLTLPDWIADPAGLFVADFELLATIPGLASVDIVCTAAVLGSGFHQRLDAWWPGIEEVDAVSLGIASSSTRPRLVRPDAPDVDEVWWTFRDREEELHAVARRLRASEAQWPGTAVVFKRPLPYLYLAPETLGATGLAYRVFDTLPLAAEPLVATVDLVLDAAETSCARESLVALLACPHLRVEAEGSPLDRLSIAALNKALSASRYLGGYDRLQEFVASVGSRPEAPAARAALVLATALEPFQTAAPASDQVGRLVGFFEAHLAPIARVDDLGEREHRARTRLMQLLADLAAAHRAHHDVEWTLDDLATAVRRWIGEQTVPTAAGSRKGIALLDDQTARYGDFSDITIVGLVEHEWPERPRRNIFYAPNVLKALGWPSERERRGADDARFLDLIASSSGRVALSTFTLDEEAIVSPSVQLDEVPQAKLTTITEPEDVAAPRTSEPVPAEAEPDSWARLRATRTPASDPAFHGAVGARPSKTWSVSALETYLGCPFRFFAQHVLRLEEEPDDEEVMDPRRQGQFVHEVFEQFFRQWQDAGHKAITPALLAEARALFTRVVDEALTRLPEGEAALERTRLLGSPAASGLGEAVFRMEAERPVPVTERLLEHKLEGRFTMRAAEGERVVSLRGKADRIDMLADGTFRLIDYKLGWPPDRNKALQLPIYAVCAEQQFAVERRRAWTLSEAVYLAFKGPRRVVPLFQKDEDRPEVLRAAQQRLVDAIDAIERGDFPPSPDDVFRCDTCSFVAVCRKDYVGDV